MITATEMEDITSLSTLRQRGKHRQDVGEPSMSRERADDNSSPCEPKEETSTCCSDARAAEDTSTSNPETSHETSDNENTKKPIEHRSSLEEFRHKAHEALDNLHELQHKAFDNLQDLQLKAFDNFHDLQNKALDNLHELPHKAAQALESAEHLAEEVARRVWEVVHHAHLPNWLKDNEYLVKGHRPQLHTYKDCFKSIFRIHSETGNIWTHMIGCLAFLFMAISFLIKSSEDIHWQQKVVFSAFFAGAILCLGFSWMFHTVYCHSERVGKIFCKLDYCGIALLIVGSKVPWLYYSFYCSMCTMFLYMSLILVLSAGCIVICMSDTFAKPEYRPVRAALFIGLGLSAVIPVSHYIIVDGWWDAFKYGALGPMFIQALLYIGGALIYAFRIPERIFPGKCDIWFQSHQIFHVFVVAAAFIHYHGITNIASDRMNFQCLESQ